MNYLLTTILLLIGTFAFGQDRIILQKKNNPNKHKILNDKTEYIIKTVNASYKSTIATYTDSTLTVTTFGKTGKDTIYKYNQGLKEINKLRPLYARNTIVIPFKEIQYIKKDLFNNRKWLEPFGYIGLGAGLGLVLLPVVAIDKGAAGVKEWVTFELILLAVSVPPIFIGTRKVTYNLKDKWVIMIQNSPQH
ncbi:hypothetical protein [Pedobacter cryophilus]|uniref:Uncharacterized protein n=1 Tax=Pedobacter cryophilus TaxID=2571271 RepID=A0A4U1BY03_9SPHI|nr:hypothetical protein [Pedobacter cryophilus]TKB96269.1 hypothetical protein FA046_13865 [Pedobacter cryophilus]